MEMKLPPQNLECEEALLGGLLLSPDSFDRLPELPSEVFYHSHHRLIFEAMLKLHAKGEPTDLMAVANHFGDAIEKVGGFGKLAGLVDKCVSTVNLDRYAAILIEKWNRRRLIAICNEALALAYDSQVPFEEVRAKVETGMTEIFTQGQAKGLTHIGDILPRVWDALDKGTSPAFPTGLKYLDQCLGGGLRPKELTVIAGRPSMGKTFVGTFASRVLAERGPVAFFSGEMDDESIVRRLVSAEAQVPGSHLLANRFADEKADDLANSYTTLSNLPIYIDDTPGADLTPAWIKSQCNRIVRKHGRLSLVVVDYLQLIGNQDSGNRVNELGKYSAALKGLAKSLNCPVIALSQLSRGVENRNDKRPIMSDIRDSGCIEQDSDILIMLYRDEYYKPDTPDRGILEFLIKKNRHGECKTAKAFFNPETATISNFTNY